MDKNKKRQNINEEKWQKAFARLVAYKNEYGHSRVKRSYVSKDGFHLGDWLQKQRSRNAKGLLYANRKNQLEEIGVCLGKIPRQKAIQRSPEQKKKDEEKWQKWVTLLEQYKEEKGNTEVPYPYVSPDGSRLGNFVSNQRLLYKNGKLNKSREEALRKIGLRMETVKRGSWEYGLEMYKEYKRQTGNEIIGDNCIFNGYNLTSWKMYTREMASNKKNKTTITKKQLQAMREAGYNMYHQINRYETRIIERHIDEYFNSHNRDNPIPDNYECEDGFPLGRLANSENEKTMRILNERGILCHERQWEMAYDKIVEYITEKKKTIIETAYVAPDGFALGLWLKKNILRMKEDYYEGILNSGSEMDPETVNFLKNRINKIKAIGKIRLTNKKPQEERARNKIVKIVFSLEEDEEELLPGKIMKK